jgi:glutaredoxin
MRDPQRARVTVLGRDTCADTVRSMALLDRLGFPFEYHRVDQDPEADAWIRSLNEGGWRTPTILLGDPASPDRILREPTDAELEAALGQD